MFMLGKYSILFCTYGQIDSVIDGYIINVNKAKKNNSRIYIYIYKQLRVRIRIVYFGIMRYAVYMYMQKYICSNKFMETE